MRSVFGLRRRRKIFSVTSRLPQRKANGFSIVEVLVALLLGTTISLTMLDMYSKVQRVGQSNQNETKANLIVQELIDQVKTLDYEFLVQYKSQIFTIPVNFTSTSPPIPPVRTLVAQLDLVNSKWNSATVTNQFPGTVTFDVEPLQGDPNALEITIVVTYTDSERRGTSSNSVGRTITAKTVVTRDGVNRWTP